MAGQNNNRTYSRSEIMAMQQDAIRRVQEMHRRSQQKLQPSRSTHRASPGNSESHSHLPESKGTSSGSQPPAMVSKNSPSSPIETILKDLNLDHDRLLLIFLLIVLINEGADRTLILALCYLLF